MADASRSVSALDRRGFIQLAVAGVELAGGFSAAGAQLSETTADIRHQPSPSFEDDWNTAAVDVNENPPNPTN